MRILFLIGLVLLAPMSAKALEAGDVERVVEKYASSVACNVEGSDFGVKAVKVVGSPDETRSHEDYFAVVWGGSFGCPGGSGAYGFVVTTVAVRSGSTPVVLPTSDPVIVPTRAVTNVAGGKGLLVVEAAAYKDGDPNCCPSGSESFIYKFDPKLERMVAED